MDFQSKKQVSFDKVEKWLKLYYIKQQLTLMCMFFYNIPFLYDSCDIFPLISIVVTVNSDNICINVVFT